MRSQPLPIVRFPVLIRGGQNTQKNQPIQPENYFNPSIYSNQQVSVRQSKNWHLQVGYWWYVSETLPIPKKLTGAHISFLILEFHFNLSLASADCLSLSLSSSLTSRLSRHLTSLKIYQWKPSLLYLSSLQLSSLAFKALTSPINTAPTPNHQIGKIWQNMHLSSNLGSQGISTTRPQFNLASRYFVTFFFFA